MSGDEEYEDFFDELYLLLDAGEPHITVRKLIITPVLICEMLMRGLDQDEMAMLINPDPVYLDDNALYAALESDSDLDYQTDEYYDDDPSLKSLRQKERAAVRSEKREQQKQAPLDRTMFCGVSWLAGPRVESNGPLYHPGDGEKVSLLKNWREVFHESKPKAKKMKDKQKTGGKVGATFHDQLSTRPRQGKGKNAQINTEMEMDIDAGIEIDLDEMIVEANGADLIWSSLPSTSLPLPPSHLGSLPCNDDTKKPVKRGPGRPRIHNGGSQLKTVTHANEEQKPAPGFEIVIPCAPANAAEYKELPIQNTPKRGRKRKADSAAEQATPAHADNPGNSSGPVKKSKRSKPATSNGASTGNSSRPTRSSTRRK
ncbi:hypothetical protein FQN49_004526 [Arthroderma sp. PD_2]|nr:hypothetical protein FQN49_004526 [Arthroderma sp. PD_2]